jgi:hypothetical protein
LFCPCREHRGRVYEEKSGENIVVRYCDMGFFGPSLPKRVTKEEWKEIMSNLYGKLDERERIELEKFFRADLDEPGVETGISRPEFEAGMKWLRDNMKKHELESDDLNLFEKYCEEHLKD